MNIHVLRHRLDEPRVTGEVCPLGARTNGRKLVLTVETVRSLRVRTHVRAGYQSSGAPCGPITQDAHVPDSLLSVTDTP